MSRIASLAALAVVVFAAATSLQGAEATPIACYEGGCLGSYSASTCQSLLSSTTSYNTCCSGLLDCTSSSSGLCASYSGQSAYYFVAQPGSCSALSSEGLTSIKTCNTANCNTAASAMGSSGGGSSPTPPPSGTSQGGSAPTPTQSSGSTCYFGACISSGSSTTCQQSLVSMASQGVCCMFSLDCTSSNSATAAYCAALQGNKITYFTTVQSASQCTAYKNIGASSGGSGSPVSATASCSGSNCNSATYASSALTGDASVARSAAGGLAVAAVAGMFAAGNVEW